MNTSESARVPVWFASIAVGAMLVLQTWMLTEIVNLKVQVAEIKATINTPTAQMNLHKEP